MARPLKRKVDYFPHFVNSGKTLFILEQKYGNDGYSFWFKLLELVSDAGNHVIDARNKNTMIFISAKMRLSEEKCYEILALLAALDAIDRELWEDKIIWIQNLVDNLSNLYRNRVSDIPEKPRKVVSDAGNYVSDAGNPVSDAGNPQSRVEKRRDILYPENPPENKIKLEGLTNKQTPAESLPVEESTKQPSNPKTEIPEFEALWKLNPKKQHSSENKQASKKKYTEANKKISHELISKACCLYWKTARREKEAQNQPFDPQYIHGLAKILNIKNGILETWIEKVREKEAKELKTPVTQRNESVNQERNIDLRAPEGSRFEGNLKRIPEHTPVDFEANKGHARALIEKLTQGATHGTEKSLSV